MSLSGERRRYNANSTKASENEITRNGSANDDLCRNLASISYSARKLTKSGYELHAAESITLAENEILIEIARPAAESQRENEANLETA
jgi:hypothetical protein